MPKIKLFTLLAALLCSCRPPETGVRPPAPAGARETFTLYAADASFPGVSISDLDRFLKGHALAKASLTGSY